MKSRRVGRTLENPQCFPMALETLTVGGVHAGLDSDED